MQPAQDRLSRFEKIAKGETWEGLRKPIVVVDGDALGWPLKTQCAGQEVYVVGATDKTLPKLCDLITAPCVAFTEMRVTDLAPLEKIKGLRHLSIHWNSKVTDLGPIGGLKDLETLSLVDVTKAHDLTPVSRLLGLRSFRFCGGMNSRNTAHSLRPLAVLPQLEDLWLEALRVTADGLRPLADIKTLRTLRVANTFPTEDYAYLAAQRPDITCPHLAGVVAIGGHDDFDRMVVGARKPFLNSTTDAARIATYQEAFEALKRKLA